MLQPVLSSGTPEIPDAVYETLASYDRERNIEKGYLDELKNAENK